MWRGSRATSRSRASRGRSVRARSCATRWRAPSELGFELKIGAELEYFLVRRTEDGGIEVADQLDTLELPCYDMRALTRNLDFVSQVSKAVTGLGWDNYATDHEDANGQFEQNFQFADALTTCDRAVFFRYMVESLAQQRGLIATFMPKPFANLTGNGCHFHVSLWTDGENVFERDRVRGPARPRPVRARLQLHRRAEGQRQGVHRGHRADRQLVQAPGRGRADERRDLGAGVRQLRLQQPHADAAHPRAGRIEDRTVDGSCNPYLARDRDARGRPRRDRARARPGRARTRPTCTRCTPRSATRPGIELLPANLLDATRELEKNDVAARTRSARPATATTSTTSSKVKRREWQAAHEQITQWELDRYLQLF